MESKLEIEKYLTLSTGHIKKETVQYLKTHGFVKGKWGWFIYPVLYENHEDGDEMIPEDLKRLLEFAIKNDCTLVCLDADGGRISELPFYEW